MSMNWSFALLVLFFVQIAVCLDATVYYSAPATWKIQTGVYDRKNGAAVAKYEPTLETKGWDTLIVETGDADLSDDIKAYAAGYLEGNLTKHRIQTHFQNMFTYTWNGDKMPDYVTNFFVDQQKWVSEQVATHKDDAYWQQIGLISKQFEGLVEGYNQATERKISYTDLHTISSFGDLFDVVNIKHDQRPKWDNMTTQMINDYVSQNTHCSALIKVTPDLSDLFFGHTSWFTYSSMTRIWKTYKFAYKNPLTKAVSISFSSYPAVLASNDDFYVTSQNLTVIETTNVIVDNKLFDLLTPKSLLCWQRAMLANRMSTTAPEWVQTFGKHNSGTYNNQFMALGTYYII
jgi:hypothetical protein